MLESWSLLSCVGTHAVGILSMISGVQWPAIISHNIIHVLSDVDTSRHCGLQEVDFTQQKKFKEKETLTVWV